MKHKIYTTYISKLKSLNFPENAVKVLIMRMPPYSLKKDDFFHCPDLGPSTEALIKYKKDNDWDSFKAAYEEKMDNDPKMKKLIDDMIEALDFSNDIYLICCEKDYEHCHRWLLANRLKSIGGYEIREL